MSQHKEDESEYEDLEELRQEVRLTSSKLLDLTYNQTQYIEKLEEFNLRAKDLITQDFIEEALIYLAEAERLLEYGASCGKLIDRNLIITTLHNEACCYYKASDLPTASKYIEAVIFNLKTHLDSVDSSPSQSSNSERRGRKSEEDQKVAVEKKIELVHYYLKYCTVNSQAKNRIVALDAGKRAVDVLKALITDLQDPKIHIVTQPPNELEIMDLKSLLASIKIFKDDVHLTQVQGYLSLARCFVRRWNENKVIKKISYGLQKHVSNYSISQVIDMMPMDYAGDSLLKIALTPKAAMRQLLHFSMAYFTISTEYRLLAEQLYKNIQARIVSQEYIKANIYHLLSILFLAIHVNCDLLFMKQIISSYEHHFKTQLLQEDNSQTDPQELAERILFERPTVRKKSVNSSLLAKIQKLRSKSKGKSSAKKVHTEYQDTQLYESKACYKLNETKSKTKTKRSVSKQNYSHKSKNPGKILNDSLFESTKNLNQTKERSTSNAKKIEHVKPRSISKDSQNIKPIKHPPAPLPKVVKKQKPSAKKTSDEYQLCNSKCPAKKRSQSISGADLSCSAAEATTLNRTKLGDQKSRSKKTTKRKLQVKSKSKKVLEPKQTFSKHYYV